MIDTVLIIVLIVSGFLLGLTLGASAIEYDRVEKDIEKKERVNEISDNKK